MAKMLYALYVLHWCYCVDKLSRLTWPLHQVCMGKCLAICLAGMLLCNVPVQGGVVNPDEHGFLDGSCHIVLFSA